MTPREVCSEIKRELSEREFLCAKMYARGNGMHTIGAELFISPKTADAHINRTKIRLKLASRQELIALFIYAGIINPYDPRA